MSKTEDRIITRKTYSTTEFLTELGLKGKLTWLNNSISDDQVIVEIEQAR